jgi:hypothetical protein
MEPLRPLRLLPEFYWHFLASAFKAINTLRLSICVTVLAVFGYFFFPLCWRFDVEVVEKGQAKYCLRYELENGRGGCMRWLLYAGGVYIWCCGEVVVERGILVK